MFIMLKYCCGSVNMRPEVYFSIIMLNLASDLGERVLAVDRPDVFLF